MNTTAHTLTSLALAAALALFTTLSAAFAGIAANTTVIGFSLFVAHGLVEIMIQSYTHPRGSVRRPRKAAPRTAPASAVVVPFASEAEQRKAA